jgi:lipopolysaccharide heptosyltransferase II
MLPYRRILIFNVNWLGDVLFSTAAIRNIRRNFPQGFIACVVPSRCYALLKDNPHLDEVVIFDDKDRHRGALEKLKFVQYLKSKRFEVVFLLHRSFTRALLCRLAGIPQRIGYNSPKRGFILTRKIKAPDSKNIHRIDYYLNLIEKAGLRVEDRYTDFFVSDADEEFVRDFLSRHQISETDFLLVLNPGGNWPYKRWPRQYWAELADKALVSLKAKVILSGGLNDIPLAGDILGRMRQKAFSSCGRLNLKQTAALFRRSDVFVSADTGPLHIANAAGAKRIIAIFGPTSPKVTGPYPLNNVTLLQKDVGCKVPCYAARCQDNRCMKAVLPEEVMQQIRLLIK